MSVDMYEVTIPSKVCFGDGALSNLSVEAAAIGVKHALIISDPGVSKAGLIQPVIEELAKAKITADVFDDSEPEPTIPRINEIAGQLGNKKYDLLIGLGGGSSIDTAKLLSVILHHGGKADDYMGNNNIPGPGIPLFTIPTTAGTGSEITKYAILGAPDRGLKLSVVSIYIVARVALVDPVLTYSCPPRVTAASGIDALVHAIECYTGKKAHNFRDALAIKAMRLIAGSLKTAVANGSDKSARRDMSEGSLLAGIAFGNSGVAAVHALAYPLGSRFHVAHGVANGLFLPYVMEASLPAAVSRYADVARLLGVDDKGLSPEETAKRGVEAAKQMVADTGLPTRLRDIDVPKESLEGMAVATMDLTRLLDVNPKQFTLDEMKQIWESAW